jgi:hypothetical protein
MRPTILDIVLATKPLLLLQSLRRSGNPLGSLPQTPSPSSLIWTAGTSPDPDPCFTHTRTCGSGTGMGKSPGVDGLRRVMICCEGFLPMARVGSKDSKYLGEFWFVLHDLILNLTVFWSLFDVPKRREVRVDSFRHNCNRFARRGTINILVSSGLFYIILY